MRVRRAVVGDWWTDGSSTVVLQRDRALLLTPVAGAVWDALAGDRWTDVAHLSARLVERFGEPDDPAAAVTAVLDSLLDAGIVELSTQPYRVVPFPGD